MRLVVVVRKLGDPYSPRSIRTSAVVGELESRSAVDVEVVETESRSTSRTGALRSSRGRRFARGALSEILLDKYEPANRRRFKTWVPDADGALLVGYPFSLLAYASARLAPVGIPYVIDIGDPWALTARQPMVRGFALARARRAEHEMWMSASGAILTTPAQRDSLRALFPKLPILVRPNGVDTSAESASSPRRESAAPKEKLALAHFGSIYESRLDIRPFLRRLVHEGPWQEVEFTQFGGDWSDGLRSLAEDVKIDVRAPIPWSQAICEARRFDAALVIGHNDPSQLPSKVVSYLSLPIPRIAVSVDPENDAIGNYLRGKGGWLVVHPGAEDVAALVQRLLHKRWRAADLAIPESELWESVSKEIVDFVLESLRPTGPAQTKGSDRDEI